MTKETDDLLAVKYDAFYRDGIYGPATRRDWRRDPPKSWTVILNEVKSLGCSTILDVGCGNCTFIRWMQINGYTCDGIEISQEGINRFWPEDARGKAIVGDVRNMDDVEDNSYDFVRCFDILEHLPADVTHAERALSEIERVARVGVALWSHHTYPSSIHPDYGPAHTLILPQSEWQKLYKKHFDLYRHVACEGSKVVTFGRVRQ